jgi:hypothetical protein
MCMNISAWTNQQITATYQHQHNDRWTTNPATNSLVIPRDSVDIGHTTFGVKGGNGVSKGVCVCVEEGDIQFFPFGTQCNLSKEETAIGRVSHNFNCFF